MVQSIHELALAQGVKLYTDAFFRKWLDDAYADESVGVRASWAPKLNDQGEQIVTITVYNK